MPNRLLPLILVFAVSVAAGTRDPHQLALDAFAHGDTERAVALFQEAVAAQPNNAVYHYDLARCYGQQAMEGSMFTAMSLVRKVKGELERSIQLDPNLMPPRFMLIEFNLSAPSFVGGGVPAAMAQAAEIRKRDSIDGHRAYAHIYADSEKLDLARKEFADMLREQPASARAHYHHGMFLLLTEKNYKGATEEFETTIRLDPSYMTAYFGIGRAAALAGNNLARGEEALRKYLTYQPKGDEPSASRAYFWLGSIYEKQGRKADAKANYSASRNINPHQKDVNDAIRRVS